MLERILPRGTKLRTIVCPAKWKFEISCGNVLQCYPYKISFSFLEEINCSMHNYLHRGANKTFFEEDRTFSFLKALSFQNSKVEKFL